MTDRSADAEAQLRALQHDYAARLPARAAELSTRFDALRRTWSLGDAIEFKRQVHNLAGSGASYGFPEVSASAKQVERMLDSVLEQTTPPLAPAFDAIGEALRVLVAAAVSARLD